LAGVVLQAQGFESGKTLFFEGDDETVIDGEQCHLLLLGAAADLSSNSTVAGPVRRA
jgi:hypothetical protein